LPGAEALRHGDDLDAAEILNANAEALAVFDLAEQPKTWGQLRRYVCETSNDRRWRDETAQALGRIAEGRRFSPVQAVFKTRDNRTYRPVALAVDRYSRDGRIHSFHLAFIEDLDVIDSSAMPPELSALTTIMRFAFRFRWEILERFGRQPMAAGDLERLENAFRRLESEWVSRDINGPAAILNCFRDEQQKRVIHMMATWDKVRNPQHTGTLDQAIARGDMEAIPGILSEFLPINQAFLEMASERFNELVTGCRGGAHGPAG